MEVVLLFLHALSQEENELLALTPTDELLNLEILKENRYITCISAC